MMLRTHRIIGSGGVVAVSEREDKRGIEILIEDSGSVVILNKNNIRALQHTLESFELVEEEGSGTQP